MPCLTFAITPCSVGSLEFGKRTKIQQTLTRGAQLEVEITQGSTDFQIHSALLTLYKLKPDRSQTHSGR
jgi:hypothetical protein